MKRFSVSTQTKADKYWAFKYRYLLDNYIQKYGTRKDVVERIERFTNYSESLLAEGDAEGAHEALLMALEVAPDSAQCHNNLGVFYWRNGERDKSVRHFADARKLDPNHRDTVWNCGQIMADVREYMMAKHIYHQYMRDNGYDAEMIKEINSLKRIPLEKTS